MTNEVTFTVGDLQVWATQDYVSLHREVRGKVIHFTPMKRDELAEVAKRLQDVEGKP